MSTDNCFMTAGLIHPKITVCYDSIKISCVNSPVSAHIVVLIAARSLSFLIRSNMFKARLASLAGHQLTLQRQPIATATSSKHWLRFYLEFVISDAFILSVSRDQMQSMWYRSLLSTRRLGVISITGPNTNEYQCLLALIGSAEQSILSAIT